MKKSEFIQKVARDANAPLSRTEPWVNAVLDSLADAIITEDELKLRGFGVFEHIGRKPRKGRNASTGETIEIPARTVVRFIPADGIADAVRDVPAPDKE